MTTLAAARTAGRLSLGGARARGWLALAVVTAAAVAAAPPRAEYFLVFLPLYLVPFLAVYLVRPLRRARPAEALAALGALVLVSASHAEWKLLVGSPAFPFAWDAALASADRWLHLGRDPWTLLRPLVESRTAMGVLDLLYAYGWYATWLLGAAAGCWLRNVRFLVAYALAWTVLGMGAAAALPSAGPAFFAGAAGAPSPYEGLLHPAAVTPFASEARDLLWWQHTSGAGGFGISAMPSLHVAVAFLYLLALWPAGRGWRAFGIAFFAVTQVGSVALGWHYALDGYAGAAGVSLLWWLSGRLVGPEPAERTPAET
ncbi:MAG TPA: phosphatase PAP2 family protein [Longimicrobiaceae bacterium]